MFSYPLAPIAELRLLEPRHAAELYALVDANRAHLGRWLGWVDDCRSADNRRAFITRTLGDLADSGAFTVGIWHLGALAGMIRLNPIHKGGTSLGYFLGEAYQGRGLMTTGCRALIHYAFGTLGAHRIEIGVATDNLRSRAIPERLGFRLEGRRLEDYPLHGRYVDIEVYAMLEREWQTEPVVLFNRPLGGDAELRLLEQHHAAEFYRLIDANRDHLRRWLPWPDQSYSEADAQAYIQSTLRRFAMGNGFVAGIWCGGMLAGTINMSYIDEENGQTEFGYWIGESYQGKGLVTRACHAFCDYAFDILGLNRIQIGALAANQRSRAVAERLGFTLEGTFRQAGSLRGEYVDRVVYSLLKPEWSGERSIVDANSTAIA